MSLDMSAFESYESSPIIGFEDVYFALIDRLVEAGMIQRPNRHPKGFRSFTEDIDDDNELFARLSLSESYERLVREHDGEVLEFTIPLDNSVGLAPKLRQMQNPRFNVRRITRDVDESYTVSDENFDELLLRDNSVIENLKDKIKNFELIPTGIFRQRDIDSEN